MWAEVTGSKNETTSKYQRQRVNIHSRLDNTSAIWTPPTPLRMTLIWKPPERLLVRTLR